MRYVLGLFIPLLVQVLAYIIVFAAARGNGSFMGLLAMPVAGVCVVMLLATGFSGARGKEPIGRIMLSNLALALIPPILLLVFRMLET